MIYKQFRAQLYLRPLFRNIEYTVALGGKYILHTEPKLSSDHIADAWNTLERNVRDR